MLACELFPLGCVLWKCRAWLHLVDPSLTRPVSSLAQCPHCVCPLYRDWTAATSHNNELQSSGSQWEVTRCHPRTLRLTAQTAFAPRKNQWGWGEFGDEDVGSLSFLNNQLSAATDSSGLAHQTLCTRKVECGADIVWKLWVKQTLNHLNCHGLFENSVWQKQTSRCFCDMHLFYDVSYVGLNVLN